MIKKIKLNKHVINFIKQGYVIFADNIEYYKFPFWLKSTEEKNVYEILSEETPVKEILSIREEVDILIKTIKNSEEKLQKIRLNCEHKDLFVGDYSLGVGHNGKCMFCSNCSKLIRTLNDNDFINFPHKQLDIFKDGLE